MFIWPIQKQLLTFVVAIFLVYSARICAFQDSPTFLGDLRSPAFTGNGFVTLKNSKHEPAVLVEESLIKKRTPATENPQMGDDDSHDNAFLRFHRDILSFLCELPERIVHKEQPFIESFVNDQEYLKLFPRVLYFLADE